jgi:hypothetical protein
MRERPLDSAPSTDDPLFGAPSAGAPGALLVVVSGPSGVGKDCGPGPAIRTTTTS